MSDQKRNPFTIPNPLCLPGDVVRIIDYRTAKGDIANGWCEVAEYRLPSASGSGGGWTYQIQLDRRSKFGAYLYRSVGDEAIITTNGKPIRK